MVFELLLLRFLALLLLVCLGLYSYLVLVLVLNVAILSAAHEFMILYEVPNLGPEGEALTLGYYIWLVSFWWMPMRFGFGAAMSLFTGAISAVMTFIVFQLLKTERA